MPQGHWGNSAQSRESLRRNCANGWRMRIPKFAKRPQSRCGKSRSQRPPRRLREPTTACMRSDSVLPDRAFDSPAHLLARLAIACCIIGGEQVDSLATPESDDFLGGILIAYAACKRDALRADAVDLNRF